MDRYWAGVLAFALAFGGGAAATQAVPQAIPFTAQISTTAGAPFGGSTANIAISLYDNDGADASSPGTLLWGPVFYTSVEVIGGVFTVVLEEDMTGSLGAAVRATDTLHLELAINGQPLVPRLEVLSVPYALTAEESETLDGFGADYFASQEDLDALESLVSTLSDTVVNQQAAIDNLLGQIDDLQQQLDDALTNPCALPGAGGTPCDDGNACTTGDVCSAGVCQGAGLLDCTDSDPCTAETCNPASGCVFPPAPDGINCNDGDACSTGDQCSAGVCIATGSLPCSDGDACTTDSCDPAVGCVFDPISPCCGNGSQESGETCDDGNTSSDDGCSSTCQSEAPTTTNYVPSSVLECGAGFLDSFDHPIGSGYSCLPSDDLRVLDTGCTTCDSGGKTANGVDLVFSTGLSPSTNIVGARLRVRGVPDDGIPFTIQAYAYDTDTFLGSCTISGAQTFGECTINLASVPTDAPNIRIYTNGSQTNAEQAYFVYDAVELQLDVL